MNIGFTYDLKDEYLAEGFSPEDAAEFDSIVTIEGIEKELQNLGHQVDRIGKLSSLVRRLAQGNRWDFVFNITEGWRGPTRESQVPALLEAYGIPVTFGDSLCLAVSLHKGICKDIVRAGGVRTPDFLAVKDPGFDFDGVKLNYPLFAKPIAEGTGKGVTPTGKAATPGELRAVCLDLLDRFKQPVLVEEYLPGREFTIGVLGSGAAARVLGVMEVELLDNAQPGVYSYENKDQYENRVRYHLAADDAVTREAAEQTLAAYRLLGCRDAGRADFRCDAAGRPCFMEINPLAGLNPLHSDLPILCRLAGMDYSGLIAGITASVMKRIGNGKQP